MLSNAGVQAIYTSQYERTKLTAEPIAKKLAINPTVIDAAKSDEFANSISQQKCRTGRTGCWSSAIHFQKLFMRLTVHRFRN